MSLPPLVEMKNCTLMRGDIKALDSIDLKIEQGESIAIVGPNGSGKSSLLKLISRQLYPFDNADTRLSILGKTHFNVHDYQSQFGLVSQDLQRDYLGDTPGLEVVISGFFGSNSLWHHFDISEEQISEAKRAIERIGVSQLTDRPFGTLSTGQQRRLLLARALVHNPAAVILDEPTSGLDMPGAFQFLKSVQSLIQQQKTILLVTHQISEIPPEIERLVLIKKGTIFADGNKRDVLTETNLCELFDARLTLIEVNGYYHVYPK